ncbi:hypothetical protein M426DRAFT_62784 [Hypoxylon sp. CI-4A]|nr:hypothetical protein M426DRAFT_62784 [Hypoxylon sp. CI-4A]
MAYGGDSVIACSIVFAVLCTLFMALRFISHRIDRRPINIEDWLMIPAWALMIGFCANVISVKYGGVGRHESYVRAYEPQALISWALSIFVTGILYSLLFPIEKTAILLLYLRLFHIHHWFRLTTYFLIAYIWVWGIVELFVYTFLCKPVSYQWNQWYQPPVQGTCFNQVSYFRWISVPNVIHDIVMLFLPAPIVWNLKIELRKKLALSCVFLVGSIGCVASLIRLSIFFRKDALKDKTWTSIDLLPWTLAEPGAIFICACLPSLWPLALRLFTKISSQASKSNKNTAPHGSDESRRYDGLGSKKGHSRGLVSTVGGHDDFIPLNDIEDGPVATCDVSGSSAHSDNDSHDVGIRVTTEWEVTGSNSNAKGPPMI